MPRTSSPSQHDVLIGMLRGSRAERGATQLQLAEQLGWRQTDISKVERGVRGLDVLELRAWIAALGGSFRVFVGELDDRLAASEMLQAQALKRRNWSSKSESKSKRKRP